MKKFGLVILIIATYLSCSNETKKVESNLFVDSGGKIHKIEKFNFEENLIYKKNINYQYNDSTSLETFYDPLSGNKMKTIFNNSEDTIISVYKYYEGNLVEEIINSQYYDTPKVLNYKNTINANGLMTESKVFESDSLKVIINYKYNTLDKISKIETFGIRNDTIKNNEENYIYNDKNLLIEHTIINYTNPVIRKTYKLSYNDYGDILVEEKYFNGELNQIKEYNYKNRIINNVKVKKVISDTTYILKCENKFYR